MADTHPGDTERLHEYWVHGEGAAKIRWGSPGDFQRCVDHLGKFIADPQGYCNLAHHAALGIYPATHAKELAGRAAMADTKAKPYGDVKYADPKNGKYPIDAEHVVAAWSYINMPKNAAQYPLNGVTLAEVKARIKAAMKEHGHQVDDEPDADDTAGGTASRAEYLRFYPLEDIHIIRSAEEAGTDGRVVEAYAAVFGEAAEVEDQFGHYLEVVEPGAFNRRLEHVKRSRAGLGQIKVLYNHGRTVWGSPSERFSMPVGVPVDIRAESRGLLTRTRYNKTPLADEVLENITSGSITSQSFVGDLIRSDPKGTRYGKYRPDAAGQLTTVRRIELGLRDYGPVVFPAYTGAEILGVRMSLPGERFAAEDQYDDGTPPDEGPAAGDPPAPDGDEHSARYHQHALYAMRSKELRESKGLVW